MFYTSNDDDDPIVTHPGESPVSILYKHTYVSMDMYIWMSNNFICSNMTIEVESRGVLSKIGVEWGTNKH